MNETPAGASEANVTLAESPVGSAGLVMAGALVRSLDDQTMLEGFGTLVEGMGVVLKTAVFPAESVTIEVS